MRIGIVEENSYPSDIAIRTTKMCHTLLSEGHEVVILARSNQKAPRGIYKLGNASIYSFDYFRSSTLNNLFGFPWPGNILWTIWILRIAKKEHLDVLIIRNIKLALPTYFAAKVLKLPLVLDLSENFPAMVAAGQRSHWVHHLTKNVLLISLLEKMSISLADHVWVVTEENRQRLISLGVPNDKVSVVSNCPLLKDVLKCVQDQKDKGIKHSSEDKILKLIYVGLITEVRGLDLFFHAIANLRGRGYTNIELTIIGDGCYRQELQDLACKLSIEHQVKFLGWVPSSQVQSFLLKADIGIIPHRVCEFTNTTIPNKLFDYMACGLPVLATDMRPVSRIIRTEQCGVVIPTDSGMLADILLALSKQRNNLSVMGVNGQQAILRRYNWETESREILRTITEMKKRKLQ